MIALAREVRSILPNLRAYACALTGSRLSGDRYLEVCLELVVNDPACLRVRDGVRLGLYKLFSGVIQVFRPLLANDLCGERLDLPLSRSILELPMRQREFILLSHLANFSSGEIAEILDIPRKDVVKGIVAVRAKIAPRDSACILVIENEPVSAIDIAEIIYHAGYALLGVATNCADARRLAKKGHPDLILADVALEGDTSSALSAWEIADGYDAPIVFITDRQKSAPKADTGPRFVIAKPITAAAVVETIDQALGTWSPSPYAVPGAQLL